MSEQPAAPQTLYSALISLQDDFLLLPNTALAEVVPGDHLEQEAGLAGWLGTLKWRSGTIPVVDFEAFNGRSQASENHGRVRLAVLHALDETLPGGAWAVRCEGYPRVVPLNAAALEPVPLRATDRPDFVLARVRIGVSEAVIPDLERVEAQIRAAQAALG